jgi:membrane associated rhomboid family serine protease
VECRTRIQTASGTWIVIVYLLVWAAMGAVSGAFLGAFQCSNPDRLPPRYGNAAHLMGCAFGGAMACSFVFLALAYAIYGSGPFSF